MKNKQTKILMIVAAILAVIYFFKDSIFGDKSEIDGDGSDVIDLNDLITEDELTNPPVVTDWKTVVAYGSSKKETVKGVQRLCNSAISITRGWKHNDPGIEKIRKSIAALEGLKVDGIFGNKTLKAVKLICGKSSASKFDVYTKANNWKLQKANNASSANSDSNWGGAGGSW